jgi:DNA-binding XRE family transcriptional regulator
VLLDLVHAAARAQQRADPVDQLRGRRLLAQLVLLAQPVEFDQYLIEQLGVEVRMVHVDDLAHRRHVGELDVVEDAAPQEGVGQFLFVVRSDQHDRPVLGDGRLVARKATDPAYPVEPRSLGDHLRRRRMELGLRQSDVAVRIGVWTATMNYWVNNHFDPKVRYVPKIIAFLGYDPLGSLPTSFPLHLKRTRIAAGLTRRQLAPRNGL